MDGGESGVLERERKRNNKGRTREGVQPDPRLTIVRTQTLVTPANLLLLWRSAKLLGAFQEDFTFHALRVRKQCKHTLDLLLERGMQP